jgi:hypothetical protein
MPTLCPSTLLRRKSSMCTVAPRGTVAGPAIVTPRTVAVVARATVGVSCWLDSTTPVSCIVVLVIVVVGIVVIVANVAIVGVTSPASVSFAAFAAAAAGVATIPSPTSTRLFLTIPSALSM